MIIPFQIAEMRRPQADSFQYHRPAVHLLRILIFQQPGKLSMVIVAVIRSAVSPFCYVRIQRLYLVFPQKVADGFLLSHCVAGCQLICHLPFIFSP